MATKEKKETKVVQLKPEPKDQPQPQPEVQALKLTPQDANSYIQILDIVLIGDDRLAPLKTHFIEMIKQNNENNPQQPA